MSSLTLRYCPSVAEHVDEVDATATSIPRFASWFKAPDEKVGGKQATSSHVRARESRLDSHRQSAKHLDTLLEIGTGPGAKIQLVKTTSMDRDSFLESDEDETRGSL